MRVFPFFSVSGFSNCYLIEPEEGDCAILIDPGHLSDGLINHLQERNLLPIAILLTHTHANHCSGAAVIRKIFGTEIYAATDIPELQTNLIVDGQELCFNSLTFKVLSTPGHSADSLCYALPPLIFTGDTLEAGTIGSYPTPAARTELIRTLREKLLSRADYELVLPGHGPPTTIGIEGRFNIHLQD